MADRLTEHALRGLEREVVHAIDTSERGAAARALADMAGTAHIRAIAAGDEEAEPGRIRFHTFVELADDNAHQYEAEIAGELRRAEGTQAWMLGDLRVLDAGPLPKGG